jgi:hypothetical protein
MTSPTSNQEQQLPPELAQIAAEAAAIAPPPAIDPNEPVPAAVVPVDYQGDAKGLIDLSAELLGMVGPRTAAALNEERRAKIAAAAAGIMEKYGLSLGAILGRWGAEINFLFALAIVAPPVARAVQEDRAETKAKERAAEVQNRPADPQPERPAGDPYATFQAQEATA